MTKNAYDLKLTDEIDDTAEDAIRTVLRDYNVTQAGYNDWKPLSIYVRDPETGEVVGGLIGRTSYKLFFSTSSPCRRTRAARVWAGELLAKAEEEARRRGCVEAVLYTIHFQAPGFYALHGWREMSRVELALPGHTRIYMTNNFFERLTRRYWARRCRASGPALWRQPASARC